MKNTAIAAAIGLLAMSGAAQAITYTDIGTTAGGPTYTRPVEGFSALSLAGVAVNYRTLTFSVNLTGVYDFVSTAQLAWDNMLFLYANPFLPTNPLVNGLISNDDLVGIGTSGFTWGLTAGATYVLVTTGFDGNAGGTPDFGAYTNTITGPGTVNVVPEPASYGLLALGLAVVGFAARRRQQQA